MNMPLTHQSFANAAVGTDANILQHIHETSKNIAIYQRTADAWQAQLTPIVERDLECRLSGTAEEISTALNSYFANELPDQQALLADILELLGVFEQVSGQASFRLLLATVSTNMCRRFHTDINDIRMLCTYVGPGTLWVPDEGINQPAYQGGKGNEDIVLDEQLIQHTNTGDVVILKGALYPDANPILHRSPSIEEHAEKRLLLRIDPNEALRMWS